MVWKAIETVLTESAASRSRSTAMQPILWLDGMLGLLLIACLATVDAVWVCLLLGAGMLGAVGFTMCVFWHFAKNSPNALRSEKFNLRKIELGMKEDSIKGKPAGRIKPAMVPGLEAPGE